MELLLVQYDKQLNAILLTTLEEEKKFIADVVKLVGEEKLPKKLVDTSCQWVRNRRPNTKYPFIYFERVLRLQANKLKLPVPRSTTTSTTSGVHVASALSKSKNGSRQH